MTAKPAPTDDASAEVEALERAATAHLFELQPGFAVFLGLHEYDGRVPDYSRQGTGHWSSTAHALLERIRSLPVEHLPEGRRHDVVLLQLLLESPLFDLEESEDLERNPMSYVGGLSLTAYMIREYAPLAQRVAAMARTLEAVPRVLTEGKHRLRPVLPEPFLKLTLAIGGGLPEHFEEAQNLAATGGAALAAQVDGPRKAAVAALSEFLAMVKDELLPRATPEFALGAERFQRLLWVREGLSTPALEILSAGRADLNRNQERLTKLVEAERPKVSVGEFFERMYRQHSTAEELIPLAERFVAETREFTLREHLATIPTPDHCRVEETPVYGRALSTASMSPPGPFDTGGEEGIYFVTPVDKAWSPERQEEWLRSLNDALLRNITVHEVYPGHYLQLLQFRRLPGSLARKAYFSASFTEGWAHYCEQLAVEAGFHRSEPTAEAAQLHDALLRNCRLVASIGLHTQGMTLEQATELFRREAHMEQLPAEREAIRGTFNPEYFCYTLGKLAILDVRAKFLASKFGGSLQAFHDRLLSFGSPPIGRLEALLAGS